MIKTISASNFKSDDSYQLQQDTIAITNPIPIAKSTWSFKKEYYVINLSKLQLNYTKITAAIPLNQGLQSLIHQI
jgi:hypothetical protein